MHSRCEAVRRCLVFPPCHHPIFLTHHPLDPCLTTSLTNPLHHRPHHTHTHTPLPTPRFRQYLFAAQSRLLLRLGRPVDVAERALRFIAATARQLAAREAPAAGGGKAAAGGGGGVRPLFKEVRRGCGSGKRD